MDQWPTVGIGILNYNGKAHLKAFLPSIIGIDYPSFTIYVIDNNSTDGSLEFLKENYPGINIISTGGNPGFAGGYNIGFEHMPEKYWLMLNSDVEVTPGFLTPMVELMEDKQDVAMCQSALLSFHQKDRFEYGGAAGGMLDRLGYSYCRGRIFETVEKDHGQYGTSEIFWAGGACSLIRSDAYKKAGGMYDYYFMHFEEIDLCWKFHRAGYKVYCQTDSKVFHVGGGSLAYQSPKKTFYNFRNNLVMVCRNSTPVFTLFWFPVRLFFDMGAAFRYLLKGDFQNFASVLKGYAAFFYWLIFIKDTNNISVPRLNLNKVKLCNLKSIVWCYYIKGKKTFDLL
ncbi:MAG: glycosyltransferase family 2 protein [Chitinophagaceae bacterium]|nr:glycosyltransferase family 2 protein [Chitinophagaceae bacterium]